MKHYYHEQKNIHSTLYGNLRSITNVKGYPLASYPPVISTTHTGDTGLRGPVGEAGIPGKQGTKGDQGD